MFMHTQVQATETVILTDGRKELSLHLMLLIMDIQQLEIMETLQSAKLYGNPEHLILEKILITLTFTLFSIMKIMVLKKVQL